MEEKSRGRSPDIASSTLPKLPSKPSTNLGAIQTHIVDVTPPAGYHMRAGTAAGAFEQPGGATQYQAVGESYLPPSVFTNVRPLQ
jgi:hypothetical protein